MQAYWGVFLLYIHYTNRLESLLTVKYDEGNVNA